MKFRAHGFITCLWDKAFQGTSGTPSDYSLTTENRAVIPLSVNRICWDPFCAWVEKAFITKMPAGWVGRSWTVILGAICSFPTWTQVPPQGAPLLWLTSTAGVRRHPWTYRSPGIGVCGSSGSTGLTTEALRICCAPGGWGRTGWRQPQTGVPCMPGHRLLPGRLQIPATEPRWRPCPPPVPPSQNLLG